MRVQHPGGLENLRRNLYAVHSIRYDAFPGYFLAFSVWNERNVRLPWDEAQEWFALLGLDPVPVLYDGPYDEARIRALYDARRDWERREGYVVTTADGFALADFRRATAKFVRAGHAQTTKHWIHGQSIQRNGCLR